MKSKYSYVMYFNEQTHCLALRDSTERLLGNWGLINMEVK